MNKIFRKYKSQLFAAFIVLLLSVCLSLGQFFSKQTVKEHSVSEMIPEGFVLLPIEISNGEDLINLIGSHGVVDLYSWSLETGHPGEQVAKALKILIPFPGDSRFVAVAPETQVRHFFEHTGPFYAVLQNPHKKGSQIHKKKIKRTITVIGEMGEEE